MPSLGKPLWYVLLAGLIVFLLGCPRESMQAVRDALSLWAFTVLPALFPFFVVAELLTGLGVVQTFGKLLEPLMRPIFHLPGAAGLVVALGFTSGFPVGAVMTRQLVERGLLTHQDGEHLVCFTNNASPLFIIGAVGTGLMHNPFYGYLLAAAHYLSNVLVGLWLGRLKTAESAIVFSSIRPNPDSAPPFHIGKAIRDAISRSITAILAVGGYILLFAVITKMAGTFGFIGLCGWLAQAIGLDPIAGQGIGSGLFEMTLGARGVAEAAIPAPVKLVLLSGVLAWSGLSIQSQVLGIMAGFQVRWSRYAQSRLIQMGLSMLFTVVFCWFAPHPAPDFSRAVETIEVLFLPALVLIAVLAAVWAAANWLGTRSSLTILLGRSHRIR
ncbi:MAG: nucleoside recognition domain-containing protein [Solirubrobacterales bacterium]